MSRFFRAIQSGLEKKEQSDLSHRDLRKCGLKGVRVTETLSLLLSNNNNNSNNNL